MSKTHGHQNRLCFAMDGPLFAAASESGTLENLGFPTESIRNLEPGDAIIIRDGKMEIEPFSG